MATVSRSAPVPTSGGPNGHPITIGSEQSGGSFQYDTLHWDGDQLLFTTNSQGEVDDIKVGSIGDVTPLDSGFSGLTGLSPHFRPRVIVGLVGNWMEPDPANSLLPYTYEAGNPLSHDDPSGAEAEALDSDGYPIMPPKISGEFWLLV